MNKTELLTKIAEISNVTKVESEKVLNAFMKIVNNTLKKGEEIKLIGFGTFGAQVRKARNGHNPKTRESIKIPETRVPKFKPGKELRESVAGNKTRKK